MTPLSDLAFMRLSAFFNDNDSPLIGQHKDALRSFMTNLEEGLKGQLSRKYHLLSLDPGMGKTQACVHFIKAWRERDFQPSGSILIGVSTLSELQAFAEASALSPSEFAVLTSNEEMNNLGLHHNLHDEAKILFTSQQMIRSRTKGKLFTQASEFYFQGQPRSLRLWDETLLPNEPVVLRRDDMMRLVSPLRPLQLEFATELDGLINLMAKAQTGDVLKVPEALGLSRGQRHVARSAVLAGSDRDTFDHLQLMVGETMVARADERFGMCLVGTTPSLPADIVPLVIIDASGRVRTTYRLWEEHRGTLQRLPSAHNSYEGLLVHLWKASSGKDALAAASTRGKFAAAIVEAFKRDPEGEWLILTYKDSRDALEASIRNASGAAPLPSLHWMHWGVHKSTNMYRNVENVIIVGQSTYRPADYLGLTLAASGLPVESNNLPETNDTKVGEFKL